jgi:UDP-glucose:(heptosyl)LPS alpha-1,3-glucosyltransferase
MKIALVHMRHAATGGTERYLNQLAAHLALLDHHVTIVCRRHEAPPHPTVRFAVLHPVALGSTQRMWAFARAVERHVAQASYDVVFGLGKTWTHDVIRLGGGCHQTYLERTHAAARRVCVRHLGTGWLRNRLALTIEARALAPGAYMRVLTNSEMVKRDVMHRYSIPRDKITVIHNGVDLERFHPRHRIGAGAMLRRACGFQAEHTVVVFLGTGYHRKGLDRLLEVFPVLLRQRPAARLLVIGYDSGLERWQARAKHLGLQAQVCFLGGRRDPEVCYSAGDLYVLPTRYDPFANSTLEALASGLPVITTTTNGGCEVLEHNIHGAILRDADDTEALLQALLQWTERARLQHGAQAARARAERHGIMHELEASTNVLLEVVAKKTRVAK